MKTRQAIIEYLTGKTGEWGGVIARGVHDMTGNKESHVERTLRKMYE